MISEMINYETIKSAAKKAKAKVSDFLALSPGADPFYCGSPGQMEKAEWFNDVYTTMGRPDKVHIRRVHYWLISQEPKHIMPNGEEYLNNNKCWGYISIASKFARYAGLIQMDRFIDRRNPPPIENCENWEDEKPTDVKERTDAEEIIALITRQFYCWNPSNTQSYLMEIWCEKSTMNDVLEPLCQRYGMNLVTGLGELSITAVNLLIKRVDACNKPTRIFYISDFDPAGEGMPISISRKIEYMIQGKDLDIKLIPLMLTPEQCVKYKLPRTPIKSSNLRKGEFEMRHGTGATELDALEALHPGELDKLISEAADEYFDFEKWNKSIEANIELREAVESHLEPIVENLLEGLELESFDNLEMGQSEIVNDSKKGWLFDSSLGYADQLFKYKEHKQ